MSDAPFIDFEARWVVVPGASSGLGRAIARELGRCGARVVLVGRNQEKLEETQALLPTGRARVVVQDLSSIGVIGSRIREVSREVGRLYGLCYCAGVVETRPLASFQAARFARMIDVNVTAGLEMARAVSRQDVIEPAGGALLFVTSIYAWVGMPGQLAYSATKGAMIAAARVLAVELARRRIRVNTLSPGLVHTPLSDGALKLLSGEQVKELEAAYPLGVGAPEDVARCAVFLLAPQNHWMTGTDLVVDGGYMAR